MSEKIAYAQWPWGVMTRQQFIDSCRELSEVGYQYFESVKSFIDTFINTPDDFRAITDTYDMHPISFYFFFCGDKKLDIDELERKIDFIANCGVKLITVQGVWGTDTRRPEHLRKALETVQIYGKLAHSYGIMTSIHPHHNTSVMSESDIDFIMNNTDQNEIGLAPDTAHLVASGCDPIKIIDRYKHRVKFTHLKDIVGVSADEGLSCGDDASKYFRELGNGAINFHAVFDILKNSGYDGYYCAELDCSLTSNKESAAVTMKYLRENL